MNYWLVKTEPETYSWDDFTKKGRDIWEGVRNYQARNNLKAMKKGEKVLFYHSGKNPAVVGIAKVVREFYPDPSADSDKWVVVDLEPVRLLKKSVGLQEIKADGRFNEIALVKNSRLSVVPLKAQEYEWIVEKEK
ncbi:MAG: EVE domain-containing protein [Cyclobacteriaceae bacterium]